MATTNGVYPCYENQFQFNIGDPVSQTGGTPSWVGIADCETFDCTFDNGVEEWHPFEHEGWVRRLQTAKSITLSVSAKRFIGDAGNDAIAALAWKNGREVEGDFQWTMPNGDTVVFSQAVISVTNAGSGASTDVAPLEFEVQSNGAPTYTPAA